MRLNLLSCDQLVDEARAASDLASSLAYANRASLLAFADPGRDFRQRWRASELSDLQRRVLALLADVAPTDQLPLSSDDCEDRGLPHSVAAARRLLGVTRGAADAVIDTLDAILDDLVPESALPALSQAVVEDLLDGPYARGTAAAR